MQNRINMVQDQDLYAVSAFATYNKSKLRQKKNDPLKRKLEKKSEDVKIPISAKKRKVSGNSPAKTNPTSKQLKPSTLKSENMVPAGKMKKKTALPSQNGSGDNKKTTHAPEATLLQRNKNNEIKKSNNIHLEKSADAKPKGDSTNGQKKQKSSRVIEGSDQAENVFNWLVHPLTKNHFMKNFWEQKPACIKRENTNYYKHIFSSQTFDKILRENALMYTKNIDVVAYLDGVKEVFNQEGRATASALWDYYSNGCSIRLLNPQTYCGKVHGLLATLQEYFGSMVGANVYLTPAGSQGFAPHFDDIEAFVLQLEGRKHWKLYNPKPSDVLCRESSANLKADEIGKPFMEVTLNAGDVLYFPRGTIHEGFTDPQSHSLHITVSVYQHTAYVDLLEQLLPVALKKAAESDVMFRKGLPLNYLKHFGTINDSKDRESMTENVKKLLHKMIDHIDIDNAADQLGRKFIYDSMTPMINKDEAPRTVKCDGPYLKDGIVQNKVTITMATKVRLLRYYSIRLVQEEENCKLYYNTENANVYHGEEEQWLELESEMIPVIAKLQNSYPQYVSVESLPMKDGDKKLQLISDLWEHGILITEERLPLLDDYIVDIDQEEEEEDIDSVEEN